MSTLKEEVKSKLDIVDIVGKTVHLTKTGKSYKGFCPFHNNTQTEALVVFPDTQTWTCFGACDIKGGDIFSFVMKRDNLDFNQALEKLSQQAGLNGNGKHSPRKQSNPGYNFSRQPDQIYPYLDETGKEVAQVCRQNLPNGEKAIRPRYHNGKEWKYEKPAKMPLYRLPELTKASPDRRRKRCRYPGRFGVDCHHQRFWGKKLGQSL